MRSIQRAAVASALCIAGLHTAWAQAPSDKREAATSKKWHVQYDVATDGRAIQTFESLVEIHQTRALEGLKTYSVSFSNSIQTGEILEAYTLKKDGRKITVPPTNFQTTTNQGRGEATPMFSDRTSISVVFPDLAVGDSVGIRYAIADKEAIFPGQFSAAQTLSAYRSYQDAQITLRAPKGLKLGIESHHLQEVPATEDGEIRTLQWRYKNAVPKQWNESDDGIWRMDESPSVAISTFDSYEAIAQAYGVRALPKTEPSTRVRELMQMVVGDEKKPDARARLLYEWVSRTITYGGNCIGVGAVVPRDLDTVLDNKMGDCKDHATLLQALLTAAGVRSEQVLIGGGYDLIRTPVVSTVNHVMNYLPDLKLYVDATAKDVPFGYLPSSSYGKPVIHVGNAQALAKTPDQPYDKTQQRLTTKLKMAKDGSASGEFQVSLHGLAAASARAYFRDMSKNAEDDFVKYALDASGYKGQGVLTKGNTDGMSDQYSYRISFEVSNFLEGGASGAMWLWPIMDTAMPVTTFASVKGRVEPNRRHACHGFSSYETYDITLAPGIKFVSVPPNSKIRTPLFDYTAKYQRTKSGLLVERSVQDRTPVSVCTAEMAADLHKHALPAAENLRTQVLYQRQLR
ncbi:MAG: DUF3857 and transglutaminase domain-containing protein [Pseudomonadota bacterium]